MSQGLETLTTLTSLGRADFSEQSYFDVIWCRRSLPMELSPSYFTRFPVRPPCPRFRLSPSQRSSPQAISHHDVHASISLPPNGPLPKLFLSVHDIVASVWLPPNGARPKLFPTVSFPFMISSLPSGCLQRSTVSFPFMMSPLRPAPSQGNSPQSISHGFLPVHNVHTSVSLPSTGALPKLFPMVSCPSTTSPLPSRSLPTKLSPSYFPQFPVRPRASSHWSSPQAISHGFHSVHDVAASSRFSQRSSPRAISLGFLSVHDVIASVSLPPNGALSPSYFPLFPDRS